jgi:hypothetical protein
MSGNFLPLAAMALDIGGGLAQGAGAKAEAEAAARVDEENARRSLLAGERDVEAIMREERMVAGEAIAGMAGSGLALGSGSAADIITASALNRERDITARRTQARYDQANNLQAAEDKRAAGRAAMTQSIFGAVSGALTGAADIRGNRIAAKTRKAERKVVLGGMRMG